MPDLPLDIAFKYIKISAPEALRALLPLHNFDINQIHPQYGYTLLHEAVKASCDPDLKHQAENIIQILLDAGSDPEVLSTTGELPEALAQEERIKNVLRARYCYSVITRFEEITQRFAQHCALLIERMDGCEEIYTYTTIARYVNQLSLCFLRKHIMPGTLVGVCLPQSLNLYATIFALWKIGAVYVPLSFNLTEEEFDYRLDDSGIHDLITISQIHFQNQIKKVHRSIFLDHEDFTSYSGTDVTNHYHARAYLIYTSGTTGQPKGVMLTHDGIWFRVRFHIRKLNITENDGIIQNFDSKVDASLIELWLAWLSGATLYVKQSFTVLNYLQALPTFIQSHLITVAIFPPAILRSMMKYSHQDIFQQLRTVVSATEEVEQDLLEVWRNGGKRKIFNGYGPTETTIGLTLSEYSGGQVSIGTIQDVFSYTTLHVLSENVLKPLDNAEGELVASGIGLAEGYWQQGQIWSMKTAEVFINYHGTKVYKTGDWVTVENGRIFFKGRILGDRQIKIQGNRIALESVEAKLRSQSCIRDVLVIKKEHILIALIVPAIEPFFVSKLTFDNFNRAEIPTRFYLISEVSLLSIRQGTTVFHEDEASLIPFKSDTVRPRNVYETEVCTLVATFLNIDESALCVLTKLEYYGANSMVFMAILEALEQKYQCSIVLSYFEQDISIASLSYYLWMEKIYRHAWIELKEENVVVSPRAAHPAVLFCIHPLAAGAHLRFYELKKCLPFSRTYALQPPLFLAQLSDKEKAMYRALEKMNLKDLAYFVTQALYRIQSSGQYFLCGWSFGGLLAMAVGSRLQSMGKEVSYIGLIDTQSPKTLLEMPYLEYIERIKHILLTIIIEKTHDTHIADTIKHEIQTIMNSCQDTLVSQLLIDRICHVCIKRCEMDIQNHHTSNMHDLLNMLYTARLNFIISCDASSHHVNNLYLYLASDISPGCSYKECVLEDWQMFCQKYSMQLTYQIISGTDHFSIMRHHVTRLATCMSVDIAKKSQLWDFIIKMKKQYCHYLSHINFVSPYVCDKSESKFPLSHLLRNFILSHLDTVLYIFGYPQSGKHVAQIFCAQYCLKLIEEGYTTPIPLLFDVLTICSEQRYSLEDILANFKKYFQDQYQDAVGKWEDLDAEKFIFIIERSEKLLLSVNFLFLFIQKLPVKKMIFFSADKIGNQEKDYHLTLFPLELVTAHEAYQKHHMMIHYPELHRILNIPVFFSIMMDYIDDNKITNKSIFHVLHDILNIFFDRIRVNKDIAVSYCIDFSVILHSRKAQYICGYKKIKNFCSCEDFPSSPPQLIHYTHQILGEHVENLDSRTYEDGIEHYLLYRREMMEVLETLLGSIFQSEADHCRFTDPLFSSYFFTYFFILLFNMKENGVSILRNIKPLIGTIDWNFFLSDLMGWEMLVSYTAYSRSFKSNLYQALYLKDYPDALKSLALSLLYTSGTDLSDFDWRPIEIHYKVFLPFLLLENTSFFVSSLSPEGIDVHIVGDRIDNSLIQMKKNEKSLAVKARIFFLYYTSSVYLLYFIQDREILGLNISSLSIQVFYKIEKKLQMLSRIQVRTLDDIFLQDAEQHLFRITQGQLTLLKSEVIYFNLSYFLIVIYANHRMEVIDIEQNAEICQIDLLSDLSSPMAIIDTRAEVVIVADDSGRIQKFFIKGDHDLEVIHVDATIHCIALHPQNIHFFLGTECGAIIQCMFMPLCIVQNLYGHAMAVTMLSFSQDHVYLLSASQDGFVKVWQMKDMICIYTYTKHQAPVDYVGAYMVDNENHFFSIANGQIELWTLPPFKKYHQTFDIHTHAISDIFVDASYYIYTAGFDGCVRRWEKDNLYSFPLRTIYRNQILRILHIVKIILYIELDVLIILALDPITFQSKISFLSLSTSLILSIVDNISDVLFIERFPVNTQRGMLLMTLHLNGQIKMWTLEKKENQIVFSCIQTSQITFFYLDDVRNLFLDFEHYSIGFSNIIFTQDASHIAHVMEGYLFIWKVIVNDVQTPYFQLQFFSLSHHQGKIAFYQDKRIGSVVNGKLHEWDILTGKYIRSYQPLVTYFTYSKHAEKIAIFSFPHTIYIFPMNSTHSGIVRITLYHDVGTSLSALSFIHDDMIMFGGKRGGLTVWRQKGDMPDNSYWHICWKTHYSNVFHTDVLETTLKGDFLVPLGVKNLQRPLRDYRLFSSLQEEWDRSEIGTGTSPEDNEDLKTQLANFRRNLSH